MNWEAIGAVGEVVGAAGVIISLLYLAAQRTSWDLIRAKVAEVGAPTPYRETGA